MEFRLLGPLEVISSAGAVDIGTPKQRAVLTMLALAPGRVVPVDRLLDELWPEDPPARALSSLHSYVSRLRRALSASGAPGVLRSRAPGYQLDVPPEAVDVVRFEQLSESARGRLSAGDAQSALAALDEALALWRGPAIPALDGGPVGRAERTRLEELRLSAVDARLAALLALQRTTDVIVAAEAAIAQSPYHERLWAQLMIALYRCGRQGDALAAYQRVRERLDVELGIAPGQELQQLQADILAQAPELAVPATHPAPPTTGRNGGEPGDAERSEFLGRADQIATLDTAVASLVSGRGTLLLVGGSAGIGKSALLGELARRAADAGAAVGAGAGVDCQPPPAYLPWAHALLQLARDHPGFAAAFTPYGNVPALLDPALADVVDLPPLDRLADAELARTRLFQGVVEGLCRLAAAAPVVLVIDDAQWLDTTSVLLLQLLATRVREAPVLVAVGYRDQELDPHAPFTTAVPGLAAQPESVRIRLDGLPAHDVATLSAQVAGRALPQAVVEVVHQRTGGNPFFVTELVRVLAAEHRAGDVEQAGQLLPSRVQEVVRRRLARLPEQVNAILSVAAVLGRQFPVEALQRVTEIDAEPLYDSVDTALVMGVLDATDDAGTLRFSHDLLRETVYGDLPPLRRARLHARAVEALAASANPDAATIAHHVGHALPIVQPLAAVPWLVAAAAQAYERMAYEQADELHAEALRLLRDCPAGEERDRAELDVRIRIAFMHQTTDGYLAPQVGEQYDAIRPVLDRVRLDEGTLPALWGWASHASAAGRGREAAAVARLGLTRGAADAWAQVVADTHDGLAAWDDGDIVTARRCMERAVEFLPADSRPLFPIVHWDPGVGTLCLAVGLAAINDDPEATLRHLAAAQARLGAGGFDFHEMYIAYYRAMAWTEFGRPEEVAPAAQRALALAQRRGYPEYQRLGRIYKGWAAVRLGDPAGTELTATALEASPSDQFGRRHRLVALHADALVSVGRFADACAVATAALQQPSQIRGGYGHLDLLVTRAEAYHAMGRYDAARDDATAARTRARAGGFLTTARRAERVLAELG